MNAAASPSPPSVGCVRPWYCWMPITTAHTLGVAPGAAVLNGDGRGADGRATARPVPPPQPPPVDAARRPPPPPPLLGLGRRAGVWSAGPTSLVVGVADVSAAASSGAGTSVVGTGSARVSLASSLWAFEQAA